MKPVSFVDISDIHWGNNRLSPQKMLENQRTYLYPYIEKSDIVFVNGDYFDAAIGLIERSAHFLLIGIVEILALCNEKKIPLRIVQGTWTHDRTQHQIFEAEHEAHKFTNDLKVIRSVQLEYLEDYDMRVLYIPDDMPFSSSDELMATVKKQMDDLGWEYVDYAFVHGSFDFALPVVAKIPIVFRQDQFTFVKFKVYIGHIHTPYNKGKFIHSGSFDRLCHGEEEPKGFLFVENDGVKDKTTFVENKGSSLFKTFDYTSCGPDVNIEDLFNRDLEAIPHGEDEKIFVRVIHPSREVRIGLGKSCARMGALIDYSHKASPTDDDPDAYVVAEDLPDITKLKPPSPENLADLIVEDLSHDPNKTIDLSVDEVRAMLATLSP